MKNKTLAIGLLTSIGLAFLISLFSPYISYLTEEALFLLSGLGIIFFGIWGSIRLIKV